MSSNDEATKATSSRRAGRRSSSVPRQRAPRSRIRVIVVADKYLICDAVRMALSGRGFEVISARSPVGNEELRTMERQVQVFRTEVGLLLAELDEPVQLRDAMAVVSQVPTRWLLLTGSVSEASWGAVIVAGAAGVLPMSVGLDDLTSAITEVRARRTILRPEVRDRAVKSWLRVADEQQRLVRQMEELTPREMAVLGLLYDGLNVSTIAEEAGVSVGTVRSQVKSILRKLQVSSQLAAVAAYRQVRDASRAGPRQ
jgi:two-component system nitrate/nitrite response regulator NarL